MPPRPGHTASAGSAAELRGAALAAATLAALSAWLVGPLLLAPPPGPDEVRVIGDASTDVIRGLWGLDHVRRSLLPPDLLLWSREVGRPGGVVGLVLPMASATLLAPLGMLFGPVGAWNLGVAILLWAAGFATAFLARRVCGSWAAGSAAGAVVLAQPTLLHALSDGTVELLALWSVPATLACAREVLRGGGARWGLAAGLLALAVALDSPYYAVFTAVLGLILLPPALAAGLRRAGTGAVARAVAPLLATALAGALLVLLLSRAFTLDANVVGEGLASVRARNSVDLAVWWHLDHGPAGPRDPSLTPTLIPSLTLATAAALALLGLPRSLPWLVAAALALALALGFDPDNPGWLVAWLGEPGRALGQHLLDLNERLYALPGLSGVRFPFRWLTAAALAVAVAGALGLARLERLLPRPALAWLLALPLAVGAASLGLRASGLHTLFPTHTLPRPAFATHLAAQPGDGVVLNLPLLRPAPRSGLRADVEVFADLDPKLASADLQWFQVVHRRPTVEAPDLQTLGLRPRDEAVAEVLRYWDDAWRGGGGPGGGQTPDPRDVARRAAARDALRADGLRWLVLDLGIYDEAAVQAVRAQLGEALAGEARFDEGAGVLVLELHPG